MGSSSSIMINTEILSSILIPFVFFSPILQGSISSSVSCTFLRLMFASVYLSGTQLMTPERRKAVWAIYGMIYAAGFTYPTARVETNE